MHLTISDSAMIVGNFCCNCGGDKDQFCVNCLILFCGFCDREFFFVDVSEFCEGVMNVDFNDNS